MVKAGGEELPLRFRERGFTKSGAPLSVLQRWLVSACMSAAGNVYSEVSKTISVRKTEVGSW